jgi:peptide/nickel transport system substrate-binding protein
MFKLATNLTVLPKHLLESTDRTKLGTSSFAERPVGSGAFRFVRWERGSAIFLAADTARLREKPGMDRVIFRFAADLNAAARAVVAGESDFIEASRPEGLAMLTPTALVRPVEYGAFNHGYVLFNTRSTSNRQQPHPILGNRELRRALAMAVDRRNVARNALDTLFYPSFGPFQRVSWAADTTIAQLPFDASRAGAILDSLGWTMGTDGIRARGGQTLSLSLQLPSVSATRRQMAVVLQQQFKQVGVDIKIEALEPAVLLPNMAQGKFDAVLHVQTSDASPAGVAQNWGGADLARSSNYGWYVNATVDSLIALATVAPTLERARPLYRQIYETIVQDAPAVFLWEPRTIALVHSRVKFDRLRPDAWWLGIPSWRIPANERIARDQAGK